MSLTLQSSDGSLVVDRKIIIQSMTIKNMLEDVDDISTIPLPNISTNILEKVIEYCTHPSEEEYCNIDHITLFQLILAANYLDIKNLMDVTCKTVANMIRGKTPDEIRTLFNINKDFSPEEEEQIRLENEWFISSS